MLEREAYCSPGSVLDAIQRLQSIHGLQDLWRRHWHLEKTLAVIAIGAERHLVLQRACSLGNANYIKYPSSSTSVSKLIIQQSFSQESMHFRQMAVL